MRRVMILAAVLAFWAGSAVASDMAVEELGAHRVRDMDEFHRVIDTRCTVCHTRERVDIAIRKRKNLERIEQRMTERGAVLTERDKNVLGTFWGNPMKSGE